MGPASHILEISQLGMKMASEVWNMINKCEANSSESIYRNPDCLLVMISLSEQEEGHWRCDIVIFKSKLTPGAHPVSLQIVWQQDNGWQLGKRVWPHNGFDWTASGIIKHFSSRSRDIICNFNFHLIHINEFSCRVGNLFRRRMNVFQDFLRPLCNDLVRHGFGLILLS